MSDNILYNERCVTTTVSKIKLMSDMISVDSTITNVASGITYSIDIYQGTTKSIILTRPVEHSNLRSMQLELKHVPRVIKPVSVRVNKEVQRASIDDLLTEEQEITANMNSLFRLLGNQTVSGLYIGRKF